jgi:tRNA A-37 threonylcarbamoyl transferase component Bud32
LAAPPASSNPFEYQEPLLAGSGRGVVLPRSKPLQQALQLLQRGGFLTVTAPPRSGVTTFLYSLKRQLPRAVYLDLANFTYVDEPPREAARILAREVAKVVAGIDVPASPVSVTDVLGALASHPPAATRTAGVPPAAPPDSLTVIVDGFDAWSDEAARKLVLAFRAAYTEARTLGASRAFSVITGSSVDLRDLTASGRTSPLNIAQHIFLPDFEALDMGTLLRTGLSDVINGRDAEMKEWMRQAMRWTGGHPALAQMTGHLAYGYFEAGTSTTDAWREILPLLREEATRLLGSTLGLLSERTDLRRTASEIYSGGAVPCDRIHRPIRDLVHLGLIRADDKGIARPRNALFEQVLTSALNLSAPHPSVHLWQNSGVQPVPTQGPVLKNRDSIARRPNPPSSTEFRAGDSTAHVGTTDNQISVHESTHDHVQSDERLKNSTSIPVAPPLIGAGTVLGGCRIIRRIGRGGMAEVYLARHVALDMDVALKVMRQHPERDRRIAQRFLREARAAAQLSHENIVQIRNVGRENDIQFIEMEYISGGSLAELVKNAPFTDFALTVKLLRGAATGIAAAHAKGIVHRDIKPDNLMIAGDGRIKVVDFGLAAVATLGDGSRLTEEGMIVGTPHFMAPEQWDGKNVDERSDIYSLGATFYNLLTGQPPFDGRTAIELIGNFSKTMPAQPHSINPNVPKPLCHAVMKMIEKDPADRYATIADLLHDPEGLAAKGL